MNKLALLLYFLAFIIPILGKLPPPLRFRQETFLNYGLPIAAVVLAMTFFRWMTRKRPENAQPPYFWLSILLFYYLISWSVKGLMSTTAGVDTATTLRTVLSGPFYGLALVALLEGISSRTDRLKAADWMLKGFAALFIVQVMLSVYESRSGELLVNYGEFGLGSLDGRDILEVTGAGLIDRFGFKMPFLGMLGQHNFFGNMLLNYNGLWLFGYLLTRSRIYLGLMLLTLLAAIGNTTRTTLVGVLLLNGIVFLQIIGGGAFLARYFKAMLLVGFIAIVSFGTWERGQAYILESNTLLMRIDLWNSVFNDLQSDILSAWEYVFGVDTINYQLVGFAYRGVFLGSFENQFIATFFHAGAIGFILLCLGTFLPLYRYSRRLANEPGASTGIAIWGITLVMAFMTLDLHLHFTSLPVFIACLFVLDLVAENVKSPMLARRAAARHRLQPYASPETARFPAVPDGALAPVQRQAMP